MVQKPKASCEEANAAMLPPINLIFLLKGSPSVLVERVSQQIAVTQGGSERITSEVAVFFSAFICFYFSTRFTHQAGSHSQSAGMRVSRIPGAAAAVYYRAGSG